MEMLKILLWLLAGLSVIILLCFGVLWLERNFPMKTYDERQQVSRGKAYRLSFFVGAIWWFVSIVYLTFGGNSDNVLLVLWLGFFVQAMTFHMYCLLTHAALPLSQKPMTTILSYGLMAVVYGANALMANSIDNRWSDKPPVNTWLHLSLAVFAGALSIMHLIQYLRDKKE